MLSSTFIDELGHLNLKPEQTNIFFKLMEERYRRHSTIITSSAVVTEFSLDISVRHFS
jgi:DNA replication protein DnaC